VAEGNVFAADVAITAFNKSEAWLDELRAYLAQNRSYAEDFIKDNIKELSAVPAKATYLMWIDCSRLKASSDVLAEYIREKTGLYLSEGCEYRGDGQNFLRLNLACPKSRLIDGMNRLKTGIEEYKTNKINK
jgi:cystathionine beta-lyase